MSVDKFVRSELTLEILASPEHGIIMLQSIPPKKEKHDSFVLSRSDLWMVWRWHGIPRVYCYCFCLEPTVRKETWMRTPSITIMIFLSKVAFWKLLDHIYLQSPFSTITRHIDNRILKDTLQFYVSRTWINMRAKFLIKTVVDVTETIIDEGAWKKISFTKNHVSLILCASLWRKPYL